MDAYRENEIERDRDDIFDRWFKSESDLTFKTWLAERPTLERRWNAGQ